VTSNAFINNSRGHGGGWNRGYGYGGYGRYGLGYGRYGYGLGRFGYGGFGYPYGGYYGYGYPYRYGFGSGLLTGLLFGLGGWGYGYGGYGGYGYGGYGGYGNWGYGYPGYGYGSGYGYPSYGYGFGGYCYPSYGYSGYSLGYGSGYGYSPYATYVSTATPVVTASTTSAQVAATTPGSGNFAEQGEAAFKSGDYEQAAYAFQHAVIDNPQNPVLILMHAQALFATGKFPEAAGATEAALNQLPKDQWGVVVANYKELYGQSGDYTTQLRALEAAVKSKPNDPALRFLLGYHYAYLGYPRQAVDQLNQVITLAPSDELAKQVRDEMQARLPAPANAAPAAPVVTPAAPVPPAPLSPVPTAPLPSAST
jgi:Flp pilus assembly protein TadD